MALQDLTDEQTQVARLPACRSCSCSHSTNDSRHCCSCAGPVSRQSQRKNGVALAATAVCLYVSGFCAAIRRGLCATVTKDQKDGIQGRRFAKVSALCGAYEHTQLLLLLQRTMDYIRERGIVHQSTCCVNTAPVL